MSQSYDYAIECRNLVHHYGQKKVLNDISFKIPKGRIVGLLGKNGAGKTTTINLLHSFLKPTSGECFLLGEPVQQLSNHSKTKIGMLLEGHIQYSYMTPPQLEKFYSAFYPKWQKDIFYYLLSKLDIRPTQKISQMSCGQRSQVALGLILAQSPELIVFDDYSLGLDPGYRRLFIEVIKEYMSSGEHTILLTSHVITDLEYLVDDVMFYLDGKVVLNQPLSTLKQNFHGYDFTCSKGVDDYFSTQPLVRIETVGQSSQIYGELSQAQAEYRLESLGFSKDILQSPLQPIALSLEDIFIAITGKY
ncbi:MAG: ABC transporter ATP-binding protein [Litorilituus sp.]|jgi:ABC-2 type transport system ATP-binding protein|nr:ABC transporter ATP-binding protein [Litorilituus sp.]